MKILYLLITTFLHGMILSAQPINDVCSGSIPLVADGSCMTFSDGGATASNNPYAGFLCGWDNDARDVWFSAVVPSSGNLTVEINEVDGGPGGLMMELHSGSCGALTPIACSTDKNRYTDGRDVPKIELEDRTAGEMIYIRVTAGGDHEVPFEICVSDAGYSDPCKIELMIPGAQSACDPMTNTFTQEFTVHYRHDGSVSAFSVNNDQFDITGSPQTVTVTLPAHGGLQNIYTRFDGDWNLCTANSSYSFGEAIEAPDHCVSPPSNDEPCGAILLTVTDGCIEYTGNNTGATHSMDDGINYNIECDWGGYAPQDVWYKFVLPSSGNVVVNTYRIPQLRSMDAIFEIYTGTCDVLNYIGGCNGTPWASLRYDGRTPGETLYIRVAESGGDVQGDFGICIIEPEPMTNDVCTDAIDVPVTSTCTGDIYSMHTATPSGMPGDVQSCEDQNNNPSRDVWFKVTVPASGSVTIFTESVERDGDDILMSIYENSCGSLSEIDCRHGGEEYGHASSSLSGRTPGEVLYVRVSHWGSWGDNRDYSAFRMCATSLDNDVCSGSISIPVGSCQTFTESGATPSNNPYEQFLCGWDGEARDVWFSAMVPASGNLTVDVNTLSGGPSRLIMELHEGTCGNLSPIVCAEYVPNIELENRTPGEIIYIRITTAWEEEAPFELCIVDAGYSDDCRIDLIVPSTQYACDPLTNTYAQDIIVYYRYDQSLTDLKLRLDHQEFDVTGSPQTVTLTLPAHGDLQSIHSRIVGCSQNSGYTSGEILTAQPYCYSGTVINDDPCGAIELSVSKGCDEFVGNNIGATHTKADGINYNFDCTWGGYSPMDVWYKFEVPSSGSVIVNMDEIDSNLSPRFEVYRGDCNNLNYIGGCAGNSYTSLNFDNLSVGEVFYVRVGEWNGDAQGDFGICVIDPTSIENDICNDAFYIAPNTCEKFTNYGASASNNPTPALSCSNTETQDVWFKTMVPMSGKIKIETNQSISGNNVISSPDIEVFGGLCDNLFSLTCEINSSSNQAIVEGLIANDTVWIRMAEASEGLFQLCVSDQGYSCKMDSVNLVSQTICDPATNTFQLEFDLFFRTDGINNQLIVQYLSKRDTLTTFSSPQRVVVNDVMATGNDNDVWFSLLEDGNYNECSSQFYYSYTGDPISTCYSGTVSNDEPCNAIPLAIQSICNYEYFSNLGATESVAVGILDSSICTRNGSHVNNDVWFSFTSPMSQEISIQQEFVDIFPRFEMYSGTCNALVYEGCEIESFQIPAGETRFLRVLEWNSDYQGDFGLCVTSACPDEEHITDTIDYRIRVEDHIKITADNTVLTGADLTYDAGQCIELQPGFEVTQGALFEAVIDGCYDQNPDCPLPADMFVGDYRVSYVGDDQGSFDILFLDTTIVSLSAIPLGLSSRRISNLIYYPDFGGFNIPPFLVEFTCTEILIEPFTTTIGCGETIFLSGAHVSGYDITSTYDIMDDSEILINIVDMYTGGLDCNVQPKILQVKLTKVVSP